MSFEYVLINRETRERAVAQDKTGNSDVLDRELWKSFGQSVFLFQASGLYRGAEVPGTHAGSRGSDS